MILLVHKQEKQISKKSFLRKDFSHLFHFGFVSGFEFFLFLTKKKLKKNDGPKFQRKSFQTSSHGSFEIFLFFEKITFSVFSE